MSRSDRHAAVSQTPALQECETVREVLFTDEDGDLMRAIERAFERGVDELFIVAPEFLFSRRAPAGLGGNETPPTHRRASRRLARSHRVVRKSLAS